MKKTLRVRYRENSARHLILFEAFGPLFLAGVFPDMTTWSVKGQFWRFAITLDMKLNNSLATEAVIIAFVAPMPA
jgi:hypothetical protein